MPRRGPAPREVSKGHPRPATCRGSWQRSTRQPHDLRGRDSHRGLIRSPNRSRRRGRQCDRPARRPPPRRHRRRRGFRLTARRRLGSRRFPTTMELRIPAGGECVPRPTEAGTSGRLPAPARRRNMPRPVEGAGGGRRRHPGFPAWRYAGMSPLSKRGMECRSSKPFAGSRPGAGTGRQNRPASRRAGSRCAHSAPSAKGAVPRPSTMERLPDNERTGSGRLQPRFCRAVPGRS